MKGCGCARSEKSSGPAKKRQRIACSARPKRCGPVWRHCYDFRRRDELRGGEDSTRFLCLRGDHFRDGRAGRESSRRVRRMPGGTGEAPAVSAHGGTAGRSVWRGAFERRPAGELQGGFAEPAGDGDGRRYRPAGLAGKASRGVPLPYPVSHSGGRDGAGSGGLAGSPIHAREVWRGARRVSGTDVFECPVGGTRRVGESADRGRRCAAACGDR